MNRITSSVVPVVVVSDELDAREAIVVHQGPESRAHLSFLRGGKLARGVGRVCVFRLVLGIVA